MPPLADKAISRTMTPTAGSHLGKWPSPIQPKSAAIVAAPSGIAKSTAATPGGAGSKHPKWKRQQQSDRPAQQDVRPGIRTGTKDGDSRRIHFAETKIGTASPSSYCHTKHPNTPRNASAAGVPAVAQISMRKLCGSAISSLASGSLYCV